ncbi:MAG TPA: hypothetical protein VMF63_03475 [Opitutaceae bacterium]|nr:hypothetical protein [Opitutaceae bacterium]
MYAGVGQPQPIPTTAAHIPQQGLVPARPKVPASAPGTRYQPPGVDLRLPGEDPYAARLRNAGNYRRRLARERRQALAGFAGFAQADADVFAAQVVAAEAGARATSAEQAAFTAAGAPVDETYAINQLVQQHRDEIAANVSKAVDAKAAGRSVAVLAKGGQVVMVSPDSDPSVKAAFDAKAAGNPVAVHAGNPLAAAAMAVTPAQAAAAAVFGQSEPDPQTAVLAKVQRAAVVRKRGGLGALGQAAASAAASVAPTVSPWLLYAVVGAGLYWLIKEH